MHRRLAAALPGWPPPLPGPAPFVPGRGLLGRVDARLRDGPGWRGACYVLLRLPLALASLYAVAGFWVTGLYYLTYPAWWSIAQSVTGPQAGAVPGQQPAAGRRGADRHLARRAGHLAARRGRAARRPVGGAGGRCWPTAG